MVKIGSEIYNMCCLFPSIYKYLVCLSESSVQLVPTILQFYSHNACIAVDFLLNLAAAVDCVQLVPKYYSKVKLRSWRSPNISV